MTKDELKAIEALDRRIDAAIESQKNKFMQDVGNLLGIELKAYGQRITEIIQTDNG